MIDANDRLPANKPDPLKTTDWLILGILVVLLAVTFPFLWWIYRPLLWAVFRIAIPLGLLAFIGYFAIRASQLGENSETASPGNGFLTTLGKIWKELMLGIRKYFKVAVGSVIVVNLLFVALVLGYTKYSRQTVTEKQMQRMTQSIARYKSELGYYPADLSALIGNDPLKREWLLDSWGGRIEYSIVKNGAGFQLLSPGADGIKGNGDDIIVTI